MIKSIKIQHSLVYDLVLSLAKLNNFTEQEDLFKSYDGDLLNKFKMNEELNKWFKKTYKKIPENYKKIMKTFFNKETFLGLDFIYYIRQNDFKSITNFIEFLENSSAEEIVHKHIVSLSYLIEGNNNEFTENDSKKILKTDTKIMEFLEKIKISPKIKWEYLQFFKNPKLLKEQYIDLLSWYYQNIFKRETKKIDKILKKEEKKLENNLKKYGNDYLELLINIGYNQDTSENKIVLALSYFLEIGYTGFEIVSKKESVFIFGYRHMEIFVERKHGILSNVHLFKAIADETRQNLLKLLSQKEWYGDEIAKEMDLSNSTVSYHLNILMLEGFIKVKRKNNRSYFTLDKKKFQSVMEDAVNRIVS